MHTLHNPTETRAENTAHSEHTHPSVSHGGLDVDAVAVSPSAVAIATPVNAVPTTARIVATVGRRSRGSTRAVAAASTKRR